jgi:glycosyltransferase involved in cell wall biosynthesis
MRIALFTETFLPKIDGIVTRLRNTISELQRSGHQVLVFAPGDGPTEFDGAQVEGMRGSRFPLYPELTLAFPRAAIRQKLLDFQPDVIHVADPAVLGVAGIYYSDVLGLPLVISYHTRLPKYLHHYGLGALEPAVWRLMQVRHNRAHLNLCTSSVMAAELEEHDVKRVRVWQKAVDTNAFHPNFASQEMRAWLSEGNPQSPLFLYVGRLSPEKQIDSLGAVLQAVPNARLAIVGGGPSKQSLQTHFAGAPVFFAGYLTGRRLAEAMASADALLLPSTTETLGLVLLEAMASGSVAIGANAGGIPDVIEHEVTGLLYDPTHEGELAAAVRCIAEQPKLSHAMRKNARRQTEDWSWATATQQLLSFYEEAMAMPRFEKSKRANSPWMLAMKRAAIGGMKVFLS